MKIRFNRVSLQEALGFVASIVPTKSPKPILQCVKIVADENGVRLSSTDLEVGINFRVVQAEVERSGAIVVPAYKANSIVRESIDDVLEFDADESEVHIRGNDSHFSIYSHMPEQYPEVVCEDVESDIGIPLGLLQEGVEQTLFAAAKECSKYAFNGVLWEIDEDYLNLVGTDGRRLVRKMVSLDAPMPENFIGKRVIVPTKTMHLIDRIGEGAREEVGVRFFENHIILSCGDVLIRSNLIEGVFPKYQDIIPENNEHKIILNTDAFLSAVKRSALLISDDSKSIKVAIGEGVMVFSGRAPETGDAQVDMAINYDGPPIDIGFDPTYLIDGIKVIKEDEISFEISDGERPVLIRAGDSFVYLVMPIDY
jgi:DNA polymerase III subunit beta